MLSEEVKSLNVKCFFKKLRWVLKWEERKTGGLREVFVYKGWERPVHVLMEEVSYNERSSRSPELALCAVFNSCVWTSSFDVPNSDAGMKIMSESQMNRGTRLSGSG